MWYIWLIAAGMFLVGEIITVGFLIFWLGIGALLAMLVSFVTDSIIIQITTFVISSIILILFTKPLAKRITKSDNATTNSFSLISKTGIVLSKINNLDGNGLVKVNGEIWSARSENNSIIEEGTYIKVLKIDGVKLIVEPIKAPSTL